MGITRLNHAVLYVSDLARSLDFYTGVLGFQRVDMTPKGFADAVFLRASASTNDHDLGLFQVGKANAAPPGRKVGLYHLAWEVETLRELGQLAQRLTEAGAIVGTADHGTTKSLYSKDPDGIEFEIVWLVPADLLDDQALIDRKRVGALDLQWEQQRYGADTRGGTGISVPAAG